jgi:hypothetical protein
MLVIRQLYIAIVNSHCTWLFCEPLFQALASEVTMAKKSKLITPPHVDALRRHMFYFAAMIAACRVGQMLATSVLQSK